MVPQDLLYTDQHEWIKVQAGIGTVGISDHAQEALGDITFVELPVVGSEVARGAEACAIESCKAAASIYAPASGQVVEVNSLLQTEPGLVNSDCYGTGWIFKIKLTDQGDLGKLLTPERYNKLLGE